MLSLRVSALSVLLLVAALPAGAAAQSPVVNPPEPPPLELPRELALESDVLARDITIAELSARLADRDARIASFELQARYDALQRKARDALKPADGLVFDLATKKFVAPQSGAPSPPQ